MNILSSLKKIRLFVLDVDGVLTDGSLLLMDSGEMVRRMNIKDGYALQLAVKKGYDILIISGGTSAAVKQRLEKLGLKNIHLGVLNKKELLLKYVTEKKYIMPEVLYMGDDIPDVMPMQAVGVACAPADAVPEVRSIAHYISPLSGGNGCVRDVIEKVMKLNGDWNDHPEIASM
ncbi:MAG: 3-deoxy-D-manno-octulosonate 8-phosphate phosphatase [Ferruginibacter sp.]